MKFLSGKNYTFWTIYLFTIITCSVLFLHTDSIYTLVQSLAYLDGHYLDFYTFNTEKIGLVPYFPSVYGFLAVWSLPLKLLGLIDPHYFSEWASSLPFKAIDHIQFSILMIWFKFLLIILFFLSSIIIKKIATFIHKNKVPNHLIFLTSPFAIFSVFIFSGYDIIGVFFTLIGFYFYLKNDITKFAIFFAFAITFKFFALIPFLPLLLLREKSITQIIKYGFISSSISIFFILIYHNDSSFFSNTLYLVNNKISTSGSLKLTTLLSVGAYFFLCIFAFFQKNLSKFNFVKNAIFFTYASYLILFFMVKWHPQWVLLLMPFLALSYSYSRFKKLSFCLEIIGFITFLLLTFNTWKDNVDQKMLTDGPFGYFFQPYYFRISDILNIHSLDAIGIHLKSFCILFLYLFLVHPLIFFFAEKRVRFE